MTLKLVPCVRGRFLALNVWSREDFLLLGYICRDGEAVRTGKDAE